MPHTKKPGRLVIIPSSGSVFRFIGTRYKEPTPFHRTRPYSSGYLDTMRHFGVSQARLLFEFEKHGK